VTKQTTQELQAIVDGAKEDKGNYHQGFKQYYGGTNALNLDNLREILELRKEVKELEQNQTTNAAEIEQKQAIRDLEQQAKGLKDYSEHLILDAKDIPIGLEHKGRGSVIYNWQMNHAQELRFRSNKLRQKAKELSK
jgi:hypothetical protein